MIKTDKNKDKKERLIRSSKLSVKFSNKHRLEDINLLIDEYQRVMKLFIDELWDMEKVPCLVPIETTSKIAPDTWLTARAVQCVAKQASGIVRGTRTRQKKRLWRINDLKDKGMVKKARKLQYIYDQTKMTKPDIKTVSPELDGRFVEQDFDKKTSFDIWLTLTSLGNKMKIEIPLQRTKHFNRMVGERLKGIRLNNNWVGFNFAQPMPKKRAEGSILGIDIGKNTVLSCSNGYTSKEDNHGWTLDKIIDRLSRRKKGSNAFSRTQQHRTNHINWTVNQTIKENFQGVKRLNIENIKNLRYGRKTNRKLTHWTYPDILDRLENRCVELGVQVHRLNPAFTSQRCSVCGWVHKDNRKGKKFRCKLCGYAADADLNASANLSLDLPEVLKEDRREHKKGKAFLWVDPGQEKHIVPDTLKV